MAINTKNERYAAMAVPWHPTHPMPNNVVLSAFDRQQVVGAWPGLTTSPTIIPACSAEFILYIQQEEAANLYLQQEESLTLNICQDKNLNLIRCN